MKVRKTFNTYCYLQFNSISPVKQSRVCITLEKFCWIINFCWLIMNKKKKLTSIITNVKVVFYVKNVSDKMTFYKKFEGQNTATERLCDVCFGSLRYLKFVAHSMMCVFVKILLRKILRRIFECVLRILLHILSSLLELLWRWNVVKKQVFICNSYP